MVEHFSCNFAKEFWLCDPAASTSLYLDSGSATACHVLGSAMEHRTVRMDPTKPIATQRGWLVGRTDGLAHLVERASSTHGAATGLRTAQMDLMNKTVLLRVSFHHLLSWLQLYSEWILSDAFEWLYKSISARRPASWSSGNAFVSEAIDLRFKFRASQIYCSVAYGSPPLRHFFERFNLISARN